MSASSQDVSCLWAQRFGRLVEPGVRVAITGGSGFIGTNLVQFYRQAGATVLSLDRQKPRMTDHEACWQGVDLADAAGLRQAIANFAPDYLLHLAARTDLDGPTLDDYSANSTGVENMLAATRGVNSLKRIVVTSTQLVCRPGYMPRNDTDYQPHTIYGQSKILTETITRACKDLPCPWVLVRPTSIWGPWFDVPYCTFFLTVARGRYFHQRGADPMRSFGFVGNVVYQYVALAQAASEKVDGRTFYLADYDRVRVRDWANLIQREMGVPPLREVPMSLLRVAAKMGDLAKRLGMKNPPMTSFRLRNLTSDNYIDVSATQQVTGPLPFDLEEGVKLTVQWMRARGMIA